MDDCIRAKKQSMLTATSPFMKVVNGVDLMNFQIVVAKSHKT